MYNNDYDKNQIMNEVVLIQEELQEELNKDIEDRNREKEIKLIYKQFIKGLKLSTRGNNLF